MERKSRACGIKEGPGGGKSPHQRELWKDSDQSAVFRHHNKEREEENEALRCWRETLAELVLNGLAVFSEAERRVICS